MNNNEITIYTKKGREIYTFNRTNLIKLEKQYLHEIEYKERLSVWIKLRQKNIQGLIKILLDNKSAERDISDLAKDIRVVPATVRGYLSQIHYSLNHLKQIKNI